MESENLPISIVNEVKEKINEDKAIEEFKKRYKKKIEKEILTEDAIKRRLEIGSCIQKVLPVSNATEILDYLYEPDADRERENQLEELIDTFVLVDQLYINTKEQKIQLMIVKGLFKAHYKCNGNIVIMLTLFIAAVNLLMGSLDNIDKIPSETFLITDMILGVLGIFIAFFAKVRDQKDELTHNLLTVLNSCNEFLMQCEKFMLQETMSFLKNMVQDTPDDPEYIGITDIKNYYPSIMQKCEDVINTFSSEESIVLINGPVYYMDCCDASLCNWMCSKHCCLRKCCILFEPEYLKTMLKLKEGGIKFDKKLITKKKKELKQDNEMDTVELVIKDDDDLMIKKLNTN